MVIADAAGVIMLVNREIEAMFGYSRGELSGRPIDLLVSEAAILLAARDESAAARGRPSKRRDSLARRKDGRELPVEVAAKRVRSGDDDLILYAIDDVTERRDVERLRQEFVATVSHELRTPLTSIAGALGLLIGNAAGRLPDTAVRLLTIAQANSERLVRLINDILDIEKIESGRIEFDMRPVDVRALLEQVIEANRVFAAGQDVRLRLLAPAFVCIASTDPDRLVQVITNLLSNAVKFSPAGGEVTVAVTQRGELTRITVRDHGPGVPLEFRSRIFEKFAQADTAHARQRGGTGLGLSIVKEIVARLAGKVGFADATGGGTIFWVELPASNCTIEREPGGAGHQQARSRWRRAAR